MSEQFLEEKDPESQLDYTVDWSEWLEAGDTVTAATFSVPTGLTKVAESHTTTDATVWLSGGVVDTSYRVTCRVTTANGRVDDRSFTVRVIQR